MNTRDWKRLCLLLLCSLFLCVSLASGLLSVHHQGNGCDDDSCLLCHLADGARGLLKALAAVTLLKAGELARLFAAVPVFLQCCLFRRSATPVEMKVKMTN